MAHFTFYYIFPSQNNICLFSGNDSIVTYAEFSRNLEKDVVSDTSGHFRCLLVSVCNAGRDESTVVDAAKAERDAHDIYAVLLQPFCSLHFLLTFPDYFLLAVTAREACSTVRRELSFLRAQSRIFHACWFSIL